MTLDDRLENWGNWLRGSPVYRQCASLEGNYRSPQCWYPPGPRPAEAWAADAWDVCLAVCTLQVRHHLVLELRWVWRVGYEPIRAIFQRELHERFRYQDVLVTYDVACLLLTEALEQPVVVRRQRAVDRVREILQRSELVTVGTLLA